MKIKLLHKTLLVIGLALVICGFSMQASADTFAFEQHSGFSVQPGELLSTQVASPENDIKWYQNPSAPIPPAGDFNTIAWGKNQAQGGEIFLDPFGPSGNTGSPNSNLSALKVIGMAGNVSTGAVSTDWGDWVTITTLYHQNNVIGFSFPSLASAIINSELQIAADTDFNSIPISFTETKNAQPPPCEGTGYGDTVCPDKFGFSVAGFVPIYFSDGGKTYEVAFQLANFVNSQQDGSGLPNMVVWTEEGQTSSLDVQMQIREVVPEPATLLLLGLGLLGLGFARRRDE